MSNQKRRQTLTETLRKAIANSGMPLLVLERETGVQRRSIRRFVEGEQSLRLDMAEQLAEFFDLELIPRKNRRTEK